MLKGSSFHVCTSGAREAVEFNLKNFVLFGASNSGRTKELVSLFRGKKAHSKFILTQNTNSPLKKLSGKKHFAITGFTIIDVQTNKTATESASTEVFFKDLRDEQIELYVKTKKPVVLFPTIR